MSLALGCTAISLTPAGTSPAAAVSPLGLPAGFGMGALIVESTAQSRTRVIDMELSVDADSSLPELGKVNALIEEEWWSSEPSSWFLQGAVGRPCLEELVSGGGEQAESW